MFLFLLSTTLLLSLVTSQGNVDGGTNCQADVNSYGPLCYSDTSSFPHPGKTTLQYLIEVSGEQEICCKAYTCKNNGCRMQYIRCGHHNWSSSNLPWSGDNLSTPRMQCKTNGRYPVYYSFRTAH